MDGPLLERMADALAFRGPDGRSTWIGGPVGLGHTLFSTTEEPERPQPLTLEGSTWVTADLRIDARDELIRELRHHVREDISRACDVELLLHAYRVWGEACPEHILGDYAFVIWDGRLNKLFAARDPFGVKPLYYAEVEGALVFSNTLNCVRLHPAVSDRLNDVVIGDFLMFGRARDPEASTFSDIKALRGGHVLSFSGGALKSRRFWAPPEEEPVRYSDSRAYVDEFSGLLAIAVRDRLRTNRVGIWMSGGLDSTLIAAVARAQLEARGHPYDLQAVTLVHHAVPDPERHYSELAAAALGVPQRKAVLDDFYTHWNWMRGVFAPEPANHFMRGRNAPLNAELASIGRVALTGWDGDALLASSIPDHWHGRIARGELFQLGREGAWFARNRLLPRGGWRRAIRRRLGNQKTASPSAPPWLDADFVRRTGFAARYAAFKTTTPRPTPRGLAYDWMDFSNWGPLMADHDPGVTGVLVENRHPLMDLRLVRLSLKLPVVPWCFQKEMLRATASRLLPADVAGRRKTSLGYLPLWLGGVQGNIHLLRDGPIAPELREFVDVERLVGACASLGPADGFERPELYGAFTAQTLNSWFLAQSQERAERQVPIPNRMRAET